MRRDPVQGESWRRHRIGRKVLVDCPVSLVRVRVGENKFPVIVRTIRMDRDYFIEFINPAPAESEPLDLLAQQRRMVFQVFDQENPVKPVRKIVTGNDPQEWAHIRSEAHRLTPPTHEEFVAAATKLLADYPDLSKLWRFLKDGPENSPTTTAVTLDGLPPGKTYEDFATGKMVGPVAGNEYRYPLLRGGHLTIRPQGGEWTITHPTRGVVGRSEDRDLALVIAQAWAETI